MASRRVGHGPVAYTACSNSLRRSRTLLRNVLPLTGRVTLGLRSGPALDMTKPGPLGTGRTGSMLAEIPYHFLLKLSIKTKAAASCYFCEKCEQRYNQKMSQPLRPRRLSDHFKLGKTQAELDFVDVEVVGDTTLFVSPTAIRMMHSEWADHCVFLMQDFFEQVLSAIKAGRNGYAEALLRKLKEPNETHLGLSTGRARGRALGTESAHHVWEALKLLMNGGWVPKADTAQENVES